jgi:hypothetical protein
VEGKKLEEASAASPHTHYSFKSHSVLAYALANSATIYRLNEKNMLHLNILTSANPIG